VCLKEMNCVLMRFPFPDAGIGLWVKFLANWRILAFLWRGPF
jgi:hypothetical protein